MVQRITHEDSETRIRPRVPAHYHRWLRRSAPRAAAAVTALLGASCLESAGPPIPRQAYFAVMPAFESGAAGIVPLAEAGITLHRVGESVPVVDTVVTIQPGDTVVDLSASVAVVSTSEVFVLNVYLLTAAGDTAFHGGPISVTPSSDASEPTLVPVELRYVGVGADAARVQILPIVGAGLLFTGESRQLLAEALDSAGNVIAGTPIAWASLDPLTATVPDDAVGTVVGASQRGTARITATLLTGPADTTLVPVQPVPDRIVTISGGGQSAEGTAALPAPIVLEVQGADGLPVTEVSLTASSSEGSIVPDSSTVDSSGRVSLTWTLGATVGTQTATVTVAEFSSVQATLTATATARVATTLTMVSGDAQTGTVATVLPTPLVVRASDDLGNPVPGAAVTWTVTLNDGTANPTVSVTDVDGLAVTAWTLGSLAGANEIIATIPGDTVPFVATGVAGAAAVLELVSGNAQADSVGAVLPQPLVVRVTDLFANPVTGVTVGFATADGGTLTPASVTTDAAGLAQSTWTLGPSAGSQTATATSAGLAGSPLTFTATTSAGAAAILETVSGDAQADTAGAVLPQPLVVRVTDQHGNAVAGITVDFATADGGSLAPASASTDAAGLARSTWTLGPGIGTQSATATSAGLAGSPITFTASVSGPAAPEGNRWTGGAGDGLWSSPDNWSLGRAPDPSDTVYITLDGTYTVTVNVSDTVRALEVGGATGAQTLSITNRTLTVDSAASFGTTAVLDLAGGTVTGTGTVDIAGSFNWSSGTLSTAGTTAIGSGAVASLSTTGSKSLYGTLVNAGTLVWTGGPLYSWTAGTIDNQAGAIFELQGALTLSRQTGTGTFINAGTLTKTGTGTALLGIPSGNSGTIDIQVDTLRFTSGLNHAAGATLQGTGALNISTATPTFAGNIEPGAAGLPGILTIVGNLTLQSSAQLNLDVDGYTVGTEYDQLVVSGAVTLGGTLNLNRDAAFIPNLDTVFPLIQYASATSNFATTNGLDPFNGDRQFFVTVGATSYDATVVAYP